MLLGGAEFLGLGAAFMFPADAQPEREVPHTHGGSPPPSPFLPPRRARPAGRPVKNRSFPKGPAPKARGLKLPEGGKNTPGGGMDLRKKIQKYRKNTQGSPFKFQKESAVLSGGLLVPRSFFRM